jgi:predicted nucleotidyltransferase
MKNRDTAFASAMYLPEKLKKNLTEEITKSLLAFSEIDKIVLFGSFVKSSTPNDIDIAIFQNSDDNYLTLSMKYRKALRGISSQIPLDVIPVKTGSKGIFLKEIEKGKVIYEEGD